MDLKGFLKERWKIIFVLLILISLLLVFNEKRCSSIEDNFLKLSNDVAQEAQYKYCSKDTDCSLKYIPYRSANNCGFCANNQADSVIQTLQVYQDDRSLCSDVILSYFMKMILPPRYYTQCAQRTCVCVNNQCDIRRK